MKIQKITITPSYAHQMLRLNTSNRPVRRGHVNFLASEMANARWQETAETISVAEDGTVVDGQHRLLAIIESGVTLDMWVASGVPMSAQNVVDMRAPRTVADQMHLRDGVKNANSVVGACRIITSVCCYYQNYKLSTAQARQVYGLFQCEIDTAIEACRPHKAAARTQVYGALAFFLKASPKLETFVSRIGDGVGLQDTDPAYAVREWLSKDSINRNYTRTAVECLANAAFAEIVGSPVKVLRSGGSGLDYFFQKNVREVDTVRVAMAHFLDADNNRRADYKRSKAA